jgi:excisionase family DNA binding protein
MVAEVERQPVLAADTEGRVIRELDSFLARIPGGTASVIGATGDRVDVPESVHRLFAAVVHELALGRAITVAPVHAELTTQQAAGLLNVSRPFLVNLLESGAMPFHRVGTHRRVRLEDVMAYRRARSEKRRTALAEMAREAQELGLYE